IIEDGIVSDLAEDATCSSGPHRALKEFLARNRGEYQIDTASCDFFGHNLTWCTNGFLKKVHLVASPEEPSLAEARRLLEIGQPGSAMAVLDGIKARRMPVRTADYLRATCFLRQSRPVDAIEALKEELRWFPDHGEASALLQ